MDTVELVSPLTGASLPVEIEGPAVLRTGHTARTLTLDGRTYVYLYGGWIPAGSSVAETGTVVVLEWVPDERRLIARTPAGGAGSFPPVAGHVQVDVPPPAGVEAASVLYGLNEGESVAAELTWRAPGLALPFDLRQTSVDALATPRTEAAGTPLDGLAVVSGGRSADGEPLGSVEVYAPAARRTFRFPASADLFVPRYGHTATIFAPGRMIVIGGRTASGVPAPVVELYSF